MYLWKLAWKSFVIDTGVFVLRPKIVKIYEKLTLISINVFLIKITVERPVVVGFFVEKHQKHAPFLKA